MHGHSNCDSDTYDGSCIDKSSRVALTWCGYGYHMTDSLAFRLWPSEASPSALTRRAMQWGDQPPVGGSPCWTALLFGSGLNILRRIIVFVNHLLPLYGGVHWEKMAWLVYTSCDTELVDAGECGKVPSCSIRSLLEVIGTHWALELLTDHQSMT